MNTITLHGRDFVPYIPPEAIKEAIARVAREIKQDLAEADPLFVVMMNGAFMFASELLQELDGEEEVAFARYSSYQGLESTHNLREVMPVSIPLEGRTVVIVEDLIDTGYTMECVKQLYLSQGAREVRIATMLLKPKAVKCNIKADYVGLEIENDFIVGHGLDYDERGRMLKGIYVLDNTNA